MQSLYRYAARLLSGARKVSADSAAAMDLVQAAIHGMLDGPDHWAFIDQKLNAYLKNAIKRQVLANLERADRLPHVSIDELTASGELPEPDELEQALRDQRPTTAGSKRPGARSAYFVAAPRAMAMSSR